MTSLWSEDRVQVRIEDEGRNREKVGGDGTSSRGREKMGRKWEKKSQEMISQIGPLKTGRN